MSSKNGSNDPSELRDLARAALRQVIDKPGVSDRDRVAAARALLGDLTQERRRAPASALEEIDREINKLRAVNGTGQS